MPKPSSYDSYIKELEKKNKNKTSEEDEIAAWRKKYRELGPIIFAERELACPPDVPERPILKSIPEFVLLSDDQKELLDQMWKRYKNQIIVAAGRGWGKTFLLAIYVTWRITCFDYFTITVMGGVAEQSNKIKEYVDFWRIQNNKIFYCIHRSLAGGNKAPHVDNRWGSYARMPGCSEASARGPHVTQVLLDEICSGESKSVGGALAIRSARGQLTSSAESLLMYTSTVQFIHGTFLKTWNNYEKLGFARFRGSTGRHKDDSQWFIEGTKIPNWEYIDTVLYKDRNPNNWISNVWWITDEDIQNYRRNGTDDEFLVEVLAGISKGAGLVFPKDDLDDCICNGDNYTDNGYECEECNPYDPEKCPMMKKMQLRISQITNRKMGFDFGTVAPNSMSVVGVGPTRVYVLFSEEQTGLRTDEVLDWIESDAKKYSIFEIFADPEERAMKQAIEDKGYSCPNIWATGGGAKKKFYYAKMIRLVEKHKLFIPKKFFNLVISMSELAYDEEGDIRKHNDHSTDALVYACSDYEASDELQELWRFSGRHLTIW